MASPHWTPQLEAVARRVMSQASGYAWMYERQVARAKKWGSVLSILAGCLGALVGARGVCSAALPGGAPQGGRWVALIEAVAGFAIAVLVILDRTWKLDVVRTQGLTAQVDFAHLARSIQFQLALRAEDRQDAREFVKNALEEIETLKLSSPTPDAADKRAYAAKYRDSQVFGPTALAGRPPEAPWAPAGPPVAASLYGAVPPEPAAPADAPEPVGPEGPPAGAPPPFQEVLGRYEEKCRAEKRREAAEPRPPPPGLHAAGPAPAGPHSEKSRSRGSFPGPSS